MKLPFYLAWVFVLVMLSHALELACPDLPSNPQKFILRKYGLAGSLPASLLLLGEV